MDAPASPDALDFAAVFAALPGATAVFAADPPRFTVLAASDALLATTQRSREAVVGRPLDEAWPNASSAGPQATGLAALRVALDAALRTRMPQRMARQRYDVQRPDGRWEARYWDVVDVPVRGADGAVRYVLHQATEVTAQVQGEAAAVRAEQAERRAEGILERMNEAHCVLDREYRIVSVNAATERLLGRSRDTLLGRSHWEVFPASYDAPVGRAFRRVVEEGIEQHPTHHYTGEGYDFHLEVDAYPTDDGGVAMFWRDVTERVRAETALRESEERRLLGLGAAGIGDWSYDVATGVLDCSPRARAMHGVGPDEPVTVELHDGLIDPADRAAVQAARARALDATSGREYRIEFRFHPVGGGTRRIESVGRAVFEETAEGPRATHIIGAMIDVTERRGADEALRASEEQFRRAIEEAPIPVIVHAEDGEVLQVSRTWTELTGHAVSDVPTFDAWLTRAYGEGADAVRGHVHALFAGAQRTMSVEFPVRTRGGELRHWSFSASAPGTLRDGRRFVVGMALDVTERRRAEEALRASEHQLRLVTDAMPALISYIDAGLHYRFANRHYEQWFGRGPEQVVGSHLREFLDDAAFERLRPHAEAALAGRRQSFEAEVQFEEGGTRHVRSEFVPDVRPDGSVAGFYSLVIDVTARKRAEYALGASEARFRTVADLVPDLLWQSEPDGSTSWYNARWLEYTGQTLEQARGGGWTDAIHPADRARAAANYARAAERGEALVQEHRIRRHDGAYRWFLVRAEPLRDETGRIVRWFGAATDVHAQRMALEEAERLAAERATERDALRRQLAAAEEAERRRLARELHDQLGQHLTAFAFGLGEVRRLLAAGQSAEAHLARLEELSLLMTRDARYLALELRPPELDDVGLESALRTYVELWSARFGVAAEVAITGAETERPIPDDASTAIYRIVQEALTNVARHAKATQVSVVLDKPDGEARLIVEDDGQGFDPEATGARVRRERRLGLASMRERAALVGGTLEVETNPGGGGTTLYVRVPLRAP